MRYNNEFKVVDTQEKAYLLGQIYGACPNCGGKHIIRAGIRAGKRRLLCKECFKRFTRPLPN